MILAGHEIATSTPSPRRSRSPRRWARRCCSRPWPGARISPPSIPATSARSTATRSMCAAYSRDYDLMFCVGADVLKMSVWSETEPLPETTAVAMVGLRDWEMGKNFPAEIALRADVKETLKALVPLLKKLGGAHWPRGPKRRWPRSRRATGAPSAPRRKALTAPASEAVAGRVGDDAAHREDAQGCHPGRGRPHQHDDPVRLFPVPRPQQLLRQCQRRHRLGHRRGGRRADRPSERAASWR